MKLIILSMLMITGMAFSQNPGTETAYQVIDQMGNLIFETGDSSLVKQMSHVKIKTISKPVKLLDLASDSTADILKTILERKFGKPKNADLYYTISWELSNGGIITLNKHPNGPPVLLYSYRALQTLRDSIPALKDDLKEKPVEKPKPKLP